MAHVVPQVPPAASPQKLMFRISFWAANCPLRLHMPSLTWVTGMPQVEVSGCFESMLIGSWPFFQLKILM